MSKSFLEELKDELVDEVKHQLTGSEESKDGGSLLDALKDKIVDGISHEFGDNIKEHLFEEIKSVMSNMLSISADKIKPETKLFEDLKLDSIDAMDLFGQLQKMIGQKVNLEDFKSVSTISDVVGMIYKLLKN